MPLHPPLSEGRCWLHRWQERPRLSPRSPNECRSVAARYTPQPQGRAPTRHRRDSFVGRIDTSTTWSYGERDDTSETICVQLRRLQPLYLRSHVGGPTAVAADTV